MISKTTMYLIVCVIFEFVLLNTVVRANNREEPICTSRFDFEEKLLHKMVRLEHKMELLQDSFIKQLNDLDNEKRQIKQETKTFLEEIKAEQGVALLTMNKTREEMEKSVKAFIDVKEKAINEKIKELNEAIVNRQDPVVLFSAKDAKKDLSGGLVTFSQVVTNVGSAYDASTGIFTAPYNGVYLFTFNVRSTSNGYCYCYIRKNATRDVYAISDGPNDMGSVTVYRPMQIGDKIDLGECGQWANVNLSGTAFSGQLVVKI